MSEGESEISSNLSATPAAEGSESSQAVDAHLSRPTSPPTPNTPPVRSTRMLSIDDRESEALSDEEGGFENEMTLTARQNSSLVFDLHEKRTLNRKARRVCVDLEGQAILLHNRTLSCYMFVNISKTSQNPAMLHVSLREGPRLKEKKWVFRTAEEAQQFQTIVHVLKERGQVLKKLFDTFDKRNKGLITMADLKKACKQVEIVVADADVERMMDLAGNNDQGIAFDGFFKLFMHSNCQTQHECIMEWLSKVAQQNTEERKVTKKGARSSWLGDETPPKLIPGEIVLNIVQHGRFTLKPRSTVPPAVGNIYLTNYRLIFSSYIKSQDSQHTRHELPEPFDELSVPLATVSRIEQPKGDSSTVILHCKDFRTLKVTFEARGTFMEAFVSFMNACAFPSEKTALFAFVYGQQDILRGVDGWETFDVQREFTRQGALPSSSWRVWNDCYTLVDTYPREFLLPAMMSESDIMEAAKFRSRRRLPALVWRNQHTGALLARSSQPMAGVSKHRCMADEKLLNLYRVRGDVNDPVEMDNPSDFYIFDARKPIAATGNQFQGKGVENEKHYENTSIIFLNIENIHAMRASLAAHLEPLTPGAVEDDDLHYLSKIEEAGWLRHIRLVMEGSLVMAEKLQLEGASVLVHCSDGWDRTAQLSATVQVMLDPYYRTIEGLCVLIEKDWCQFGHKFQDRIGHADSNYQSQERSPIFIQWLEVMHQLMLQFPLAFEYTEKLLVFIADHLYSGLFGTFLENNDRQRKMDLNVVNQTMSIWTYVLSNTDAYTNRSFAAHDGPIWPSCSVRSINVWDRYYHRWDSDMHPRSASGNSWKDDWGTEQTDGVDTRADLGKQRSMNKIVFSADAEDINESSEWTAPPPSFDTDCFGDLMAVPPPPLEEVDEVDGVDEYVETDDTNSP